MKKKIKEGDIREALKARVEAYGGEIRAVSWLGRNNAPDVLCLFPGEDARGGSLYWRRLAFEDYDQQQALHPFIETKAPKKSATAAQAREHERMRAAGCEVLVITDLSELDAWLPPI